MKQHRPLLLLTNDDGVCSAGLETLERFLTEIGEIFVVAPDKERNASSHSLTLGELLYVHQMDTRHFSVTGTPTDCVNIALHKLLPRRPDLVVSGINKGANLAEDVTYSGTVSAALEARLLGIESFAVSIVSRGPFRFESAALVSVRLARWILDKGLPPGTFLNVNVPNLEPDALGPMKLTRLGRKAYGDVIERCTDKEGRVCFRFGRDEMRFLDDHGCAEETDWKVVERGSVSVTPLRVNMTDEGSLPLLRKQWEW